MTKLSQRLQKIANMVPQGATVADIGTDHGFLPCWLASERRVKKVIACDVNEQPLELARKNIRELQLEYKISTRLGDGLQVLIPGEVDVVTISGMGGGLMQNILENSPKVVDSLQRIILQPNVGADRIRVWAEKNQWHVAEEDLVLENGRFSIILAIEPGREVPMSAVEIFLGPQLLKKQHPLLGAYINEEWNKTQYIREHLQQTNQPESKKKVRILQQKWESINGVIQCQCGVKIL